MPDSAILCVGPLVPFDEKVSVAAGRVPLPEGVNRTVIVQLLPAGTDVQLFPVNAYSVVFPEIGWAAVVRVMGPLPELVMVKDLEAEAAWAADGSVAASAKAVTSERKLNMCVNCVEQKGD